MLPLSIAARTVIRTTPRVATVAPLRLFLRSQSTSSKNSLNKNELPFKFSATGPNQVKYSKDHEWIALHSDGTAFLGITEYASAALGDATYIELPEVDAEVESSDSIGSVESVKSASEIYMPVSGTIIGANDALEATPQLINSDPMGKGWIAKVKVDEAANKENLDGLFTLDQYENFLKSDE